MATQLIQDIQNIINLKGLADYVSYTEKSVPSAGSPTRNRHTLNINKLAENATAIVEHTDGGYTIKSTIGCVRFWPK